MRVPTLLNYSYELHGWRKLWARLRRRPWQWEFEMNVEIDTTPTVTDGAVTYSLRARLVADDGGGGVGA